MRSIVTVALVLALAAPAPAKPLITPNLDPLFADFARPDAPGCVVGVSGRGRVISRAYGLAELDHRVPLTIDSIVEAGSVSKQFTAAAVLLLVEDGKLGLGDDVRRYIPELPDYGATITIDHLLNHTSGLRDWGEVAGLGGWPRETRAHTQPDAIDIIRRQRFLNHAPGAEYSYTNSGYNLLTEIVQRVSGESLATFSHERLFVPLGMSRTSWRDDFRRIVPGRAVAYLRGQDGFRQRMPFEDVYGNGGLLTTVGDLLRWNDALTANRVGKRVGERLRQTARLNDGTAITYARGLFVERRGNEKVLAHSGATAAYRAWLARFPDRALSVALLCNRGDVEPTLLGWRVARLFLPPEPPKPVARAYAGPERRGLFVNRRTGRSVTLSSNPVGLTVDGDRPLPPIAPDRFGDERGTFRFFDADSFRAIDTQGQSVDYRRAEPTAPGAAQLASYAGSFSSDEADVTYVISAEGDGLVARLDRRPHVKVALKPTYADAFEGGAMIIRFERDATGAIAALTIGVPRVRAMRFIRRPDID